MKNAKKETAAPLLEIIKLDDDGVYREAADKDRDDLQRFTIYAGFADDVDGFEEIDVDAISKSHARRIGEAAIALDYEKIVVKEVIGPRFGLYV